MNRVKLFTRDFNLLMCAHFLQALGFSSMLLFPLYLDSLEASRAEIGTIMAVAAVGGLFARPWIAWALDHLGRRKTLSMGTAIIGGSMLLVLWIVDTGPVAYGMRLLFGIGAGACFSGYFTFAADLIPESRRTEGLALFGVTGLLPLLVNPLSSHLVGDPSEIRLFLPVVGLAVFASLIPLLQVTEKRDADKSIPWKVREVLASLKSSTLIPVWFVTFAFSGLVAVFFSFTTVTAQDRDILNPRDLWYMYALGAAVVRISGARILDRIGPSNLVAPALASYIGSVLVASTASTHSEILVAGLLAGLGHGICFPVLTSQVVSRTPSHHRGSAMAMFTAIWSLSGLIMPPLFGYLADLFDDEFMFLCASIWATLLLGGWVALEHLKGTPKQHQEAI